METYRIVDQNERFDKTLFVLKHNETIETHSHPGNGEEITVLAGRRHVDDRGKRGSLSYRCGWHCCVHQ